MSALTDHTTGNQQPGRSFALAAGSRFCPDCKRPLEKVEQAYGSMLNEDQFDSVKAGDYFCRHCTGIRGRTGYRYFWLKETLSANAPAQAGRAGDLRLPAETRSRPCLQPDGWVSVP
jgi:hypothetical protein